MKINTIMSCVKILDPLSSYIPPLRQCFSIFENRSKKMRLFSLPQVKYLAVFVSTAALSVIFHPGARQLVDPRSTALRFLYFLSFSTHYGAQMFMTFVVGLLLFFNLPRIWFGHIQSKLFPLFFSCSFMLTSTSMAAFVVLNQYNFSQIRNQMMVLSTMLFLHGINAFIVSPNIIKAMSLRFELEKESGKAYEVGFTDVSELVKTNPKYAGVNRRFRRLHGLCGALNVFCLAFNTLHLYYISLQCLL